MYLNDVLQKAINDIAKELFKGDDCQPQFIVSVGCDKKRAENPDLFCTCIHNGIKVTRLINFNEYRGDFYSTFNVTDFVKLLYSCTM